MSHDKFWSVIAGQLTQAYHARSSSDVLRIFAVTGHNSPAFFAGSGGEDSLMDALDVAGWDVVWARAGYHWCMAAPDGSMITYVEGDIFDGNDRPV